MFSYAQRMERGFVLDSDGLVCKRVGNEDKIVVPNDRQLRHMIIEEFHSTPLGGHLGAYRVIGKICQSFWWKTMRSDVRDFIKGC